MMSGINKVRRNMAAGKARSDFEMHLIKATFDKDEKEPKAKHVEYLIQSFKGQNIQAQPKAAFNQTFEKFLSKIGSWVHTLKCYIIFHVALQDQKSAILVAEELKVRESMLYPFVKPISDLTFESQRSLEISQFYSTYIKSLAIFINKCNILFLLPAKYPEFLRTATYKDVIWIYEQVEDLISSLVNVIQFPMFCKSYRIYKYLYGLIFVDLGKFYKICAVAISDLIAKTEKMDLESAKKLLKIYSNFSELTSIVKKSIESTLSIMSVPMCQITFFQRNDSVITTISEYIDIKAKMGDQNFEEKASDHNSEEEYKIEANMEDLIEGQNEQKYQINKNPPIVQEEEEYNLGDQVNAPFDYQPKAPEVKKQGKIMKPENDFSDLFNLHDNNNTEQIEFPEIKENFNNPGIKPKISEPQKITSAYKPPVNPSPKIPPPPQKNNAYSMFATYYATAVQNNEEGASAEFNAPNQTPSSNNQNPFEQFQNNYSN